jgi:predicted Zn finger-like uncharacterized protein
MAIAKDRDFMRLICPNCTAQYEVPADVIPQAGRDVQCSNCSHTWFQQPFDENAAVATVPDLADVADPPQTDAPHETDSFERDLDRALADALDPDLEDGDDDNAPMAAAPALPTRPKRQLDSTVASVLREEAEREKRARQADPVETQGDLGLDYNHTAQDTPTRRKSGYLGPDLNELDDLYRQGAKDPDFHRRDLLPDIEEINSTLRNNDTSSTGSSDRQKSANQRAKSRSGFILALVLIAGAAWAYFNADQIAQTVPSLADPIAHFKVSVDTARAVLDDWVKTAMIWLEHQADKARANS